MQSESTTMDSLSYLTNYLNIAVRYIIRKCNYSEQVFLPYQIYITFINNLTVPASIT